LIRTLEWLLVACFASAFAPQFAFGQAADVPYVPTPMNVVDAMLKLAEVNANDFVIDLGSGDGRIVITAAKKYGARGFGVDLDPALVRDARREAERQGLKGRVEFIAQNLFITDIDRATVLTTYLFPQVNMQLRPRIFAELKPGSRVVSHEFDFGNWKPDARVTVPVPDKPYGPPRSEVFLWIVPANAAGRWQWHAASADGPALDYELTLAQTFQDLRGDVRAGGRPARLESARLKGDTITLVLVSQAGGREIRQELTGRVSGDTIRGTMRSAGAADRAEWHARRVTRGRIDIEAAGAAAVAVHSPLLRVGD
jgi:hypothetical protein